ncbi:two-component system sensor histidine kinase YesM [Salirhabdus euzebyi]|uniref:Two-component system sensor histidine kinase YesM n=1 Tax=Salirhabdus euzebyi TaxID=394506 RepID=A0A841Q823_9BACI|nr:sensor histidine kinase [Salirhabdus euzebyi]MBB6454601.1 two-component system sensor histidine kinase YesM [Salirhabdus euzebyi]
MINKIQSLNLRTKLMIVILITSITPLLLLGFFTFQYISSVLQEEISENELEKLSSINNQFTYFLKDIEQMTLFFYKNDLIEETLKRDPARSLEEKYEDYDKVNEVFETIMGVKDWEVDIYVIGLNGDRYFSNEYLPNQYNRIRENWGILRKANEGQGTIVWDTNYSVNQLDTKEIVLSAGRLLVDSETNEKLGYILVDIHESALSSIYEENNYYNRQQFFLLDEQGYVISGQPDKRNVGTRLEADYFDRVMSRDSGFFKFEWEETPSILTYHTASETGLKLISMIPLNIIEQKNNLIRSLTWNLALLGIIFSAWLAYFLSKTITQPLYKIMFLMKEVEKGNLDVRFDSKFHDDIGILGKRFNRMLRQLKVSIQESYEKQVRMKDSELKALRAQINPHFLYNTLETVNWLARLKGVEDISKIVVSLSDIMKYSVRKGEDFVTIEQDVKQLQNYLTIQEYRYKDKFDVQVHVDEEIKDERIPALLLQPIVENAIVHGLENKMEKGNISISITEHEANIKVVVKDDGVGMNEETLEIVNRKMEEGLAMEELGIGIENVRKRLFLSYGDNYSWNLTSKVDEGTCIEIIIPYKEG